MHAKVIKTRQLVQIRTHAQKVFKRLVMKGGEENLMKAFGLSEGFSPFFIIISQYFPLTQIIYIRSEKIFNKNVSLQFSPSFPSSSTLLSCSHWSTYHPGWV